ncbi:MAG: HAMP domain-containing histidine kinase [Fuerstiella sp.]|nr:HAMP domain-containing histidine kinase [Fuerstiella sp.]
MKPRSLILMLLIVGIPCAVLVWAAVRISRSEQVVVEQQFHDLMRQRLSDVSDGVDRYFQQIEARLQDLTSLNNPDISTLRQLGRTEPLLMQMFLVTPEGHLQYPDPEDALNGDERRFLLKASKIFTEKHLSIASVNTEARNSVQATDLNAQAHTDQVVEHTAELSTPAVQESGFVRPLNTSDTGWFVWYWDSGLNLIYWNRRPSGQIVGAALDRSRWMADLIGRLPDSSAQHASPSGDNSEPRIRLVNAASYPVYQWGRTADDAAETVCEIALTAPLSSWRLQCLIVAGQHPARSRGTLYGLAGGVMAVGVAVGLLAFVLIRDFAREMNDARRQVSFVNQVSHELKTPLTNICLYAELLEKDMERLPEDSTQQPRKRLDVILSEGQRLSRLIGNVLTFARQERRSLRPTFSRCVPDEIIAQVLRHFYPVLAALEIRIDARLNAAESRTFDTDFLEQILGNLISNVEKYAADSESLTVSSHVRDGTLVVEVIDDGPGIADNDRDRIFEPFVRLSQDVSSAAGTGIGLSISRELARLHGGDVALLNSSSGLHFVITLCLS